MSGEIGVTSSGGNVQFSSAESHGEHPPSYSMERYLASDDQPDGRSREENHRRLSISSESDVSTINEDYDVASISSSIDDKLTWRGRMQLALHSHVFHYTIVILVVLDAIIVLLEFLLDIGAFGTIICKGDNIVERREFCHFDPNYRNICGPPANLVLEGLVIQPDGADPERSRCTCAFRGGKLVCVPETDGHALDFGVNPGLVLHFFSLAILSVFMFEVVLKMIAFRFKYFTHKFEVFDGIIVVISWTLDVASVVEEEAFEVAALLIILRLWRILRIVNGSILAAKAKSDEHLREAKKEAKRIIHAFHKARDSKVSLEKENLRLRKQLESSGTQDFGSNTGEKPDLNQVHVSSSREE